LEKMMAFLWWLSSGRSSGNAAVYYKQNGKPASLCYCHGPPSFAISL